VPWTCHLAEQQIPVENEIDSSDATAVHFICINSEREPLGTARLIPEYNGDKTLGKLGRFAVLKECR